MKTFLTALLGVIMMLFSLSSCTDQYDVDIKYESGITVSAAHIFDSFQSVKKGDFDLSKYPGWQIDLSVFIYDDSGKLIDKVSQQSNSISDILRHELELPSGKYKAISIARFGKGSEYFWIIENPENLSTFIIEEAKESYNQFVFETLGIDVREIIVENQPPKINIEVPPVTGLLQIIFYGRDMTGYGKNGYSEMSPYCKEVNIWAPRLMQQVRFTDGVISYEYGIQNEEYRIGQFTPQRYYNNNSTPDIYNYRAVLPIQDRDFYWDITFEEGKGANFGLNDFQVSAYTTKLNIESGKQYDLDLLFDGKYLFAQNHNQDEDMTKRLERLVDQLNAMAFNDIMDRHFDTYIGASRTVVEDAFKKGTVKGHSLYYYNYNLYVSELRFDMDDTMRIVEKVSLQFKDLNDDFKTRMIDYLTNRFTVYEMETDGHIKTFINANTFDSASIKIVWNLDKSLLTYDKLN